MLAGYSCVDITPKMRTTLCGFVARCNELYEDIDTPIYVRSFAVEQDGQSVLVLAFDLLGLGEDITNQLHARLDELTGVDIPRTNRIFCCTHTHSAPAAIKTNGCGVIDPAYIEQLIESASKAASQAVNNMQTALLRTAEISVPGANYNRRSILTDGRVVVTEKSDMPICKRGPGWEKFLFLSFEDTSGHPIAGICNWAAHACTMADNKVSGDYPTELCRRLSERFDMPFIFLQGACGNLNPPFEKMTQNEMLSNVDAIMQRIDKIPWSPPVDTEPFKLHNIPTWVRYNSLPSVEQLQRFFKGMKLIAETGEGPQQQMSALKNLLNIQPGQVPDIKIIKYVASALQQWSSELIADSVAGLPEGCELSVKVWNIGPVTLCFVAAEVFIETAIAIQQKNKDRLVAMVGYASPMRGYLPTDEAIEEGGYEVDYAYRFYGHPAVFAKGSEPAVLAAINGAIT